MKRTPAAMNPFARLALALSLTLPLGSPRAAPGDELIGCWSARSVVSHLQDGTAQEYRGQACTMEVQPKRIVTRCNASKDRFSYEYTYDIVKPGLYRATVPTSLGRPETVREYHYEVTGDRLRITTYPTAAASSPTATVKVVSESQRTACEK